MGRGREEDKHRKWLHPPLPKDLSLSRACREGRRPEGGSCTPALAVHRSTECQLAEDRLSWQQKGEGWYLCFSQELQKSLAHEHGRPYFLPRGVFFLVLRKHTWLQSPYLRPEAQCTVQPWSPEEIKCLAKVKHFDVKTVREKTNNTPLVTTPFVLSQQQSQKW